VQIEQPLVRTAPWARAEWTFTPAGFRPSAVRKDLIVPICSPGLPLLMTAAQMLRVTPMLVVPLCGALAVWTTFLLGRRVAGGAAGAASALLLASSPIFLFQVVQPMTDVPAAAWWLLVLVLAGNDRDAAPQPLAAGIAAGIATLIRPNLAPLAIVVAVYIAVVSRREPARPVVRFVAGLAPGLAILALFQSAVYGSPFASGYGNTADLFTTANVLPNATRYGRWLSETHTPLLALGAIAPLIVWRPDAWLFLIVAAATIAAYLPYQLFDAWWYLRFLLLAIALLIVLSTTTIAALARRTAARYQGAIVSGVAIALSILWIAVARERAAFELHTLERPFVDAGTFVADRLPERAAVITLRYSGSVAYYSGRPTLSWDTLDGNALDSALTLLRAQNYVPVLLLDTAEEVDFRSRFAGTSAAGRLDWPPAARIGRTVRVYDPADRARFLAGGTIDTIELPDRAAR
jgi:hypothetical protein